MHLDGPEQIPQLVVVCDTLGPAPAMVLREVPEALRALGHGEAKVLIVAASTSFAALLGLCNLCNLEALHHEASDSKARILQRVLKLRLLRKGHVGAVRALARHIDVQEVAVAREVAPEHVGIQAGWHPIDEEPPFASEASPSSCATSSRGAAVLAVCAGARGHAVRHLEPLAAGGLTRRVLERIWPHPAPHHVVAGGVPPLQPIRITAVHPRDDDVHGAVLLCERPVLLRGAVCR
mmetsp:Transcript_16287/g.41433  ORF Transcript_16287/g.41433 Transcript_16287/m.41433 type:complete len:236 (+) Transcript_16287:417-1124(+)